MASVRKLRKDDPESPWVVEYTDRSGKRRRATPTSGLKTAANGGTIGIIAASRDHVLEWHEAGATYGGIAIESPPMERPNGAFVAYLRDPDGNKLTARTAPTR